MIIASLSKSYSGALVLNTQELKIKKNRIYALVGANGSGKTTLARLLSRMAQSDGRADLPEVSVG